MISTEERYPKKQTVVDGKTMAYVEVGNGNPIVFLHGNPTSSYLWRNVIPHLEAQGRCIAPDLIGMGDSDKLAKSGLASYRFVEHRHYLDALLEQLGVTDNVTLVVHDWGSALGFDWARRNPRSVKAIAYMEAIVMPISWDDFPEAVRPVFQAFRSPAGEDIVLQQNVFVEQVLPGAIIRKLTDAEMNVYRRPYQKAGESRRPTLTWPRELPIDDRPPDVVELVRSYGAFLSESSIPKLFINAEPGAILRGRAREYCRTWPEQTEITVKGVHFIQEDSPDEIGEGIAQWLAGLDDVEEA